MKSVSLNLILLLFPVLVFADEDSLLVDDFEKGGAAPNGWIKGSRVPGVSYKYDKRNGRSGKRSLLLEKSANRYFPIAQWSRKLKHTGDANGVKVSGFVRAENATKAVIDLIFLDDRNRMISHEWAAYIGAENNGDPPANHDWKSYTGKASIPKGTKRIQVAFQMYGPGKVWLDDLHVAYSEGEPAAAEATPNTPANSVGLKIASETGSYLFIPPKGKTQAAGAALLVVLPGGDGSADFHPFINRIHENSLGDDFALAQPIAKKWDPRQAIVWPTEENKVAKQGYSTELLIEKTIESVQKTTKLNQDRIYVLAWSSGGPAAYSALLKKDSPLRGGLIAMSVFKPDYLPRLENGKGKKFYLLHSPDDKICPYWMAKKGNESLTKAGAYSQLVEYNGGHGWRGNVFGNIQTGIQWLEKLE